MKHEGNSVTRKKCNMDIAMDEKSATQRKSYIKRMWNEESSQNKSAIWKELKKVKHKENMETERNSNTLKG